MYTGLRASGAGATAMRPADKEQAVAGNTWFRDRTNATSNDGTELDATWANRVKAVLEALPILMGTLADGDDQLKEAVVAYVAEQIAPLSAAIALRATIASPAFTGTPTAPTPADLDNSQKLATTQYLDRLRGTANGVATLGSDGKLATGQIPAALLGQVEYIAGWNASTNSPALASGVGTKGTYYVVTTAGATALDGVSDWGVGDWAIFNGTVWQKVDNTDAVISVAGLVGIISAASLKAALSISAADISDASANGRSLIQAANYAAMRTALGLGSAALLTAGTAASNVVQLDGTAKLPAVDGSQLTGLAAGGLTLISTQLVSSAVGSVDFTSGLDDTYDFYELIFEALPATNDVGLQLRVQTGGSTWQTSGYHYNNITEYAYGGGGSATVNATSAGFIRLSNVGGSGNGVSNVTDRGGVQGILRFHNPELTRFCVFRGETAHYGVGSNGASPLAAEKFLGAYATAAAITGLRFLFGSGNIAAGRFTLYGRKKS